MQLPHVLEVTVPFPSETHSIYGQHLLCAKGPHVVCHLIKARRVTISQLDVPSLTQLSTDNGSTATAHWDTSVTLLQSTVVDDLVDSPRETPGHRMELLAP